MGGGRMDGLVGPVGEGRYNLNVFIMAITQQAFLGLRMGLAGRGAGMSSRSGEAHLSLGWSRSLPLLWVAGS